MADDTGDSAAEPAGDDHRDDLPGDADDATGGSVQRAREGAPADGSGQEDDTPADGGDRADDAPSDGGGREVVVPQELFRVIVVFSTVLSILAILLGFMLLDAATRVVENPAGSLVVDLLRAVTGLSLAGVEPHLTTIALVVGLLGLAGIGLGVWIYAVGTRFRTEIGKHNNAADEGSDNG